MCSAVFEISFVLAPVVALKTDGTLVFHCSGPYWVLYHYYDHLHGDQKGRDDMKSDRLSGSQPWQCGCCSLGHNPGESIWLVGLLK